MSDRPWLAAALLLAVLLACKSSEPKCRATLLYQGKSFEATGDSQDKAKESVCLGWCSAHDPVVDEAWKRWKATPEGARSTDTRFGEVYSTVPGGRELIESCKARCLGHIATTTPTPVTVTCAS